MILYHGSNIQIDIYAYYTSEAKNKDINTLYNIDKIYDINKIIDGLIYSGNFNLKVKKL